jgi:hypothetical protein
MIKVNLTVPSELLVRLSPQAAQASRESGSGLKHCAPALASSKFALAGGVNKAGWVIARWVGSPVVDEVVHGYRFTGDHQPPSFPFEGRLRRLIGG